MYQLHDGIFIGKHAQTDDRKHLSTVQESVKNTFFSNYY